MLTIYLPYITLTDATGQDGNGISSIIIIIIWLKGLFLKVKILSWLNDRIISSKSNDLQNTLLTSIRQNVVAGEELGICPGCKFCMEETIPEPGLLNMYTPKD